MHKSLITVRIVSFLLLACLGRPVLAITPISSFSNTQENTTATSFQNSDVFIPGSSLLNGEKYLILYSVAYGGNGTKTVPEVAVTYGGTSIAVGSDEGSSSGTPEAMRIASLHGYYILTADGSSDLRIQFRILKDKKAYIKGKALVAIPLADLVLNQDYWFVEQNGDAAEVTTTAAFTSLLQTTLNLPENGDYLVLNSAEGWTPSGSNSDGESFRTVINSNVQKSTMSKEWEDNKARRSFSYARIHNLTSGNNTFGIEVGSAQGSASKSFRRGRIVVIRGNAFDQLVSTSIDTDVTTQANHPSWDNYITQTYTPNQTEAVVVIGNTWTNQGQNFRSVLMRLQNATDNTYFSDFITDDSKDINVDRAMLTVFGQEQISTQKTYRLQIAGESPINSNHHFQYGDLIVWSMTLANVPNQPPVVSDIPNQTVLEGSVFTTINLDSYVTDPDHPDSEMVWTFSGNTELTVDITSRIATITIPSSEWNGTEIITFTATDPGLLTDSDPATFTVSAVNDPPVVSDIPDQTVVEGSSFATVDLNLYVVDVDNPDNEISWSYAGNTELTVAIDASNIATITVPTVDWNGSETITFTATDPGLLSDFDPAVFAVTAVNDAPVVSDIPDQTVAEGASFTTVDLNTYVSDVDNVDSEITWAYSGNTALSVAINVSNIATITIPSIDWNGSETITFTATDPGLLSDFDSAAFTVTAVNDAPIVSDIPDQTVAEGASFTTVNLNTYVSDVDNLDGEISWTYTGNTSLTVAIDPSNIAMITIPTVDWNGAETITFTATDPGLLFDSDPATFTVTAVNDAPVVTDIPNQTVAEGATFTTINLNTYVSDVDNLDSEIIWTYVGNTALTVSVDSSNIATVTIPTVDWNGAEMITFTATDPGLLTDSDPATFTVTAVNDAPIVSDIPDQTVAEGGVFTTVDLNTYVSDVDNPDSAISWTFTGNMALTVAIDASNMATITIPNADWNGSETVTFTATDPGLLSNSDPAIFTVSAVNDAPIVSDIPDQTVVEGSAFATIDLNTYVTDVDNPDSEINWSYAGNTALTVLIDASNVATVSIPTLDWNGSETITFTATDPGLLSDFDPAIFTVTAVNDAPVVSDIPDQTIAEGSSFATVDLNAYVSDVDNLDSEINWSYSGSTALTVSIDMSNVATVSVPSVDWNGSETITFTATDPGLLSDSDSAIFTVTAVNDAPVVSNIPDQTIPEGSSFATVDLNIYVSDVDNLDSEITWTYIGNTALSVSIDTANIATISTPGLDWNGSESITFTATDPGLLAASDSSTFTVTAVNDAPVVSDIPNQTVAEGGSFTIIDLNTYVADIDNLDSEISWTYSGNTSLSVVIDPANIATVSVPTTDWNGSESIVFTASDPGLLSDSDTAVFTVTAVNDAPVVSDIPDQTVTEGASFTTVDLNTYVTDIDNLDSEITWSYTGNTSLTVTIDGANIATVTIPNIDWNGAETVTFTATDPGLLSNSDTALFTVSAVNDGPIVSDIPDQTIAEGANFVIIDLNTYVSDVDNLDSQINWSYAGNTALTVMIDAFNIATVSTPGADWFGTETITFTATDPGLLTDSDSAIFTITAVNDAPVVSDIPDQTVPEGSSFVTVDLNTYVADVDNPDSAISWNFTGNVALTVAIDASNMATITIPGADWNGSETVTFTATDPGLLSNSDSAIFTVTAVNDAPVVSDIPDQTLVEGSSFATIDLNGYVSDIDNLDSEITWTVSGNTDLSVSIDGSQIATIMTPSVDWYGSETITFTATDPGLLSDSDLAVFTLTAVNDAPVVSDIPDQTIPEGSSFTTINLNGFVSDVDNPDSVINWTYAGNTELTVSIDASNVATVGIPNVNWNGSETITFTATDPGALSDSDSATFTVTTLNDPPIVTDIPNQTVSEGLTFTTINLDNYVSDADNADSEMVWTFSGNTDLAVSITGRVATITTPNTDWNGAETITFTATDSGALSDSDPATFTVTAVNDNPIVTDIPNQSIAEGSNFNTIDLNTYVSDVDNPDSEISWTFAGNTELVITIDSTNIATIVIPNIDWNGSETVTFTATDPGLLTDFDSATFTVTAVNDPPVVSGIPDQTVAEGSNFATIDLNSFVTDVDNLDSEMSWTFAGNTELTVSIDTSNVATIAIPTADWNGSESIIFAATDPGLLSDSDTAVFTVTAVNDAPVVADIPNQTVTEGSSFVTIDLNSYVADVDNPDNEISWSYSGNTALTISIDGSNIATVVIPTIDWFGTETVIFTATDPGLLSDSDTVVFTVTAVNDAPIVSDIPNQTVAEGTAFTTIDLNAYVADVDNLDNEIVWTYAGNVELIVGIDAGNLATVTIPDINWNGSETVTFTATDPGLLSSSDTAIFTVTAVNDAPVVADIPDQTVSEGSSFATVDLNLYVTDVDNPDSLISWTYSGNTELIVSIDSSRIATVSIPNIDWNGTETVTFMATDPGLLSAFDTAAFTVTAVNDAPVVSDIPDQTVPEGSSFTTIDLNGFVADVDNLDSEINWSVMGNVALSVSIDVSNIATVSVPYADWNGLETITFTATDPGLLFASDSAVFTVTAVNDAPVVSDIPDQTVDEGSSFAAIDLNTYVNDVDNLDSEIGWTYSGNVSLSVTIDGSNIATVTAPGIDWFGSELIIFTATDPGTLSDSDSAAFTLSAVNDAPVVADIPNQTVTEGSSFTTVDLNSYVSDVDNTDIEINWTYAGNTSLSVAIDAANIATITSPGVDWNGIETITFTATDPGLLSASDSAVFTVIAVNDAPVVSNIPNQTIAEGNTFATVALNDYVLDVDNPDTEISWTYSGNTDLVVSLSSGNVATITMPSIDWFGTENITFTATDPGLLSDSDSAIFTVSAVNDAPIVSDIPDQTVAEGGSFASVDLNSYVADVDNPDSELVWSFTGNSGLSVSISPANVATITIPSVDWNGTETLTFTATDPGLLSASDSAVFTVNAVNDPPVLSDIPNQTVDEGMSFTVIDLNSYVTDIDNLDSEIGWTYSGNTVLTVSISASNLATIAAPTVDWNGSEAIMFTATDPGLLFDSDSATFTINAVNDSPVVADIPDQIVLEGSSFVTIDLNTYVVDVDNQDSEISWTFTGNTALSVSISTSNVATVSIPGVEWNGSETITFTASDPGLLTDSDSAVFTVTAVNDAPIVADIPDQTVVEGSSFTTIDLAAYVTDIDNQDSEISWTYSGNAELTVTIDTVGIATITAPSVDWFGSETITFTATDPGLLSASDSAVFLITAVNDAPIVTDIPDQSVMEGSSFTSIDLNSYVTDVDNLDSDISWTFSGNVELTVSIDSLNIATVTPPTIDWNGSETVTFTATDPGLLSAFDSATFTVISVNDAPIVSDIPDQTIVEGSSFAAIDLNAFVWDIDNLDSEISWTFAGSVELTVVVDSLNVATITIPNLEWNGSETVTFTATDPGLLSASDLAVFTVTAVNDTPIVSDIPDQVIAEGATFATISLDNYVSDVDSPDSELVWTYSGNTDLMLNITARVATIIIPTVNWNGSETITFIATDTGLLSDSDPATFTVTAVNDAPIVSDIPDQTINEGDLFGTVDLNAYVTDIDDPDSLINWTFSGAVELVVSIDASNIATVTIPTVDWNGSETITFVATDPGFLIDSDSAIFTAIAQNDPPVVSDIPDQTVAEGSSFSTIDLNGYVSDVDDPDSALTWTYTGNTSLVVSIDGSNMATIFIPDVEWSGAEAITFTATDPGMLSSSDSATFTVFAVNDPPFVSDIPDQAIPEGNSFAAIDLNMYVSDVDDSIGAMVWSYTGNIDLTVLVDSSNVATITVPFVGWIGVETITFRATDPGGLFDEDPAVFEVVAGPGVANVFVGSNSPAPISSDDLYCTYSLNSSATGAAISWFKNNLPLMNLYTPFEGGLANAFSDLSGNNFTVTAVNNPIWDSASGYSGFGGFTFTGNDYLDAGESFPTTGSYTKVARVLLTAVGENSVISSQDSVGGHALIVSQLQGGRLTAGHWNNWYLVQDTTPLNLNTWYFVAVSFDYSTGEMILYKDSMEVARDTVAAGYRDITDATTQIGAFANASNWHGVIDDARVYSDVVSAEQLLALYHGPDTVRSIETTLGDQWYAEVTPFNGTDMGTTVASNVATIGFVNQPPTLDTVLSYTVDVGDYLSFELSASDPDPHTPHLTMSQAPGGAILTDHLDGTGTFEWTPDYNQFGDFNIVFYAVDDSLAVDSQMTVITVIPDTVAPTVLLISPVNDSITVNRQMQLSLSATDDNPMTVWIYGSVHADPVDLIHVENMAVSASLDYEWSAAVMEPDSLTTSGLWHLDDYGSAIVSDQSIHNNVGALYGNLQWSTEGRFGYALGFSGNTSDYVGIGDDNSLDVSPITGTVTLEAWINPNAAGDGQTRSVIAKRAFGSRAVNVNYEMLLMNDRRLAFGGGGFPDVYPSTIIVPSGTWSYVAIAVDANENTALFYFNGQAVDSAQEVAFGSRNNEPLYIGGGGVTANSMPFHGLIDEIRISNSILDATAIRANYMLNNGIHSWRAIVSDASGNRDTSETREFLVYVPEFVGPSLISPPTTQDSILYDMVPTFLWTKWIAPNPYDTSYYRIHLGQDSGYVTETVIDSITDTAFVWPDSLAFSSRFWWKIDSWKQTDTGLITATSNELSFYTWVLGDVNHSHGVDVSDLTFLVEYLFVGGPSPSPTFVADINGDCAVDVADITYIVEYLFVGGPPPAIGCGPARIAVPQKLNGSLQ